MGRAKKGLPPMFNRKFGFLKTIRLPRVRQGLSRTYAPFELFLHGDYVCFVERDSMRLSYQLTGEHTKCPDKHRNHQRSSENRTISNVFNEFAPNAIDLPLHKYVVPKSGNT